MKSHFVQVKLFSDDSVEKEIACDSEKQAVKVADGIDINLNHDMYYTEVIEREVAQKA